MLLSIRMRVLCSGMVVEVVTGVMVVDVVVVRSQSSGQLHSFSPNPHDPSAQLVHIALPSFAAMHSEETLLSVSVACEGVIAVRPPQHDWFCIQYAFDPSATHGVVVDGVVVEVVVVVVPV
jgi:hypothetical protein